MKTKMHFSKYPQGSAAWHTARSRPTYEPDDGAEKTPVDQTKNPPAYPIDRMTAAALVMQRNPEILNNDAEHLRAINTMSAGMSLRDYFAAKALQGLLAGEGDGIVERYALSAYRLADAMLAARGQS